MVQVMVTCLCCLELAVVLFGFAPAEERCFRSAVFAVVGSFAYDGGAWLMLNSAAVANIGCAATWGAFGCTDADHGVRVTFGCRYRW